uniref:Uncharacterized protein n=1 Tax=Rhizophora mucronata TaxID=61149 RepID=A0A2P2QXE2_RHIMU
MLFWLAFALFGILGSGGVVAARFCACRCGGV